MPDFHLQLEELVCISSSFLPGADEIVLQSRLMDVSAATPKVIQPWKMSGPWSLNNGQQVLAKNLWICPVPQNPYPDKVQLDVVMQKQEAFLQSGIPGAPLVNINGNVTITVHGPGLPGITPPSVQVTGNPVKGLLSTLFENDDLGHWSDVAQAAQIQQLQAGGVEYIHNSGKKSFGKWGSAFHIQYKLLVM